MNINETYIKIQANAMRLMIYNMLMNVADTRKRINAIVSGLRGIIHRVYEDFEGTQLERTALVFEIFNHLECGLCIDPSPLPDTGTEDWSLFMNVDRPEFFIYREETERYDEMSICITFNESGVAFEHDL